MLEGIKEVVREHKLGQEVKKVRGWTKPIDQIMTKCPQCGQTCIDRDVCICGTALKSNEVVLEDDKYISYGTS